MRSFKSTRFTEESEKEKSMNHGGGNETKKKRMAHENPIKRCLAQPRLKRRFVVETKKDRNIKKRERD